MTWTCCEIHHTANFHLSRFLQMQFFLLKLNWRRLVVRTIEKQTLSDSKRQNITILLSHIFLRCVCMSEYVTAIYFSSVKRLAGFSRGYWGHIAVFQLCFALKCSKIMWHSSAGFHVCDSRNTSEALRLGSVLWIPC